MSNSIFNTLVLASLLFAGACAEQKDQNNEGTVQNEGNAQVETINTAATVDDDQSPESATGDNKMQAAKDAFSEKYPEASSVSWDTDENGYYEASFEQDGDKYRADYTDEGQWVETERSIKFKDLPQAVQKAVEAEYNKDEITEVEQVENAERGQFYDVEFKQKGKNHDVEFREDGQIIKQ